MTDTYINDLKSRPELRSRIAHMVAKIYHLKDTANRNKFRVGKLVKTPDSTLLYIYGRPRNFRHWTPDDLEERTESVETLYSDGGDNKCPSLGSFRAIIDIRTDELRFGWLEKYYYCEYNPFTGDDYKDINYATSTPQVLNSSEYYSIKKEILSILDNA